jgi:type I restriction enzyme M protein
LFDLKIPLPPLEEQLRIVSEIEGYQNVLEGARQILAGYRPFLEIDQDWVTTVVGELFNIRYGVSVSIPETEDKDGTLIISTAETRVDGSLDFSKIRRVRWEKNYDKFLAKPNTLLFNWRNAPKHVGKTILFEGHSEKILFASFLLSLERKTENIENKFVWLVLNQLRYQGFFVKHARQAVNQANFNADELSRVEIPLPPLEDQRRIVAGLDAEAAQMAAVRSLLPRFEAKIQRVIGRVWGNNDPE